MGTGGVSLLQYPWLVTGPVIRELRLMHQRNVDCQRAKHPEWAETRCRVWESLGEHTASRCLHSKDGTATSAATQTSWRNAVAGFWLLALCMKLYLWEVACKSDILNEPIPVSVSRTFWYENSHTIMPLWRGNIPFLKFDFPYIFFLINPNLQMCCLLKTRYRQTTEIRNRMIAIKHLLNVYYMPLPLQNTTSHNSLLIYVSLSLFYT